MGEVNQQEQGRLQVLVAWSALGDGGQAASLRSSVTGILGIQL